MRCLLDAAPWVDGVTLPEVLPCRPRRLLASEATKRVCGVSLLETAILHRLGRFAIDGTLLQFFQVGLSADLRVIYPTPAIAAKTNDLPPNFPGDPFDRTIVATAAALDLRLITADPAIRDAKACAVEHYPFKPSRSRT